MLVQNRFDRPLIEVASRSRATVGERVVEQLAKLVIEPALDRHAEALLLTIDYLVGNQPPNCRLQNVLPDRAPQLERSGNRLNELNELVIQQRLARFYRVGHAHAIDLREDVAGEISLAVEVEQMIETFIRMRHRKQFLERLRR